MFCDVSAADVQLRFSVRRLRVASGDGEEKRGEKLKAEFITKQVDGIVGDHRLSSEMINAVVGPDAIPTTGLLYPHSMSPSPASCSPHPTTGLLYAPLNVPVTGLLYPMTPRPVCRTNYYLFMFSHAKSMPLKHAHNQTS